MIKQVYRSLLIASVCLFLCSLGIAQVQAQTITGKVSDESGRGIPGVNVIKKGTTEGTTTDADGAFTINVTSGTTLVFSFIGYTPEEVQVTSQTNLNITLKEDIATLSEVVVVGYGEMRKSDVTSAMTTVSSKDIGRTINTTFDQALQGRAAGVYVTQNTGAPGGGVSVTIRGISTISGTTEPLYVVDGIQIQGSNNIGGSNPLSSLNPSDIDNVEILQGPNATAIYGSRATNGVVIITTKRGKSGELKINYNYMYTLQDQPKNLDVMNLQQLATMYNEYKAATNQTVGLRDEYRDPSLLGAGTDWQHALFNKAVMQKHQVSVSGGTDKSSFYLSGERMTQDGIAPNSGFNRTSVRLNADNKIRKWFSIGTNIMVAQTNQKLGTLGTGTNNLWNNLILSAIQLPPDIPVRNLDGTYGSGVPIPVSGGAPDNSHQFSPPNPIGLASLVTNNQTVRTLLGGVNGNLNIIKGLDLRSSFNTNIGYTNSTQFYPTYYFSQYQNNATSVLNNQTNLNTYWSWSQTLSYVRDINKHHINVMATHEAQESYYKNLSGTRSGLPTNTILDLNVGDPSTSSNGGGQGYWAMESYLGRLNYNYDNRYIITAAFRSDGSANFGPGNKWGNFPSVSAAYRISNEKFFPFPQQVNDLRLRYETGVTGNQGNGGAIYGTLNPGITQWGTSFVPAQYPNQSLKWEKTSTNNFGVTLGLFGSRIQIDADYYIKNTNNLILPAALPYYAGSSGASSIAPPVVNIGSMENKGWSLALNTININSNGFRWESNFNISAFSTKVTALTTGASVIQRRLGQPKGNSPFVQQTIVGQTPWQFLGYIQDGVYQNVDDVTNSARPVDATGLAALPVDPQTGVWVGDAKYRDISGPDGKPDGLINQYDLTSIGNPFPKWFGGFTNNFSYKGFDLSMLITFSYGNQIYNLMRDEGTNPNNINLGRNMFVSMLDYAKVSSTDKNDATAHVLNPGTSVPRINVSGTNANNNFIPYTSTYVEDGSYARLKNVTLGYTIPKSLLSKQGVIQGIKVAVSAQNLFTVTNYKGYDPEVGAYVGNSYSGDPMIGVDYGRYPQVRMYSFSVNLDF